MLLQYLWETFLKFVWKKIILSFSPLNNSISRQTTTILQIHKIVYHEFRIDTNVWLFKYKERDWHISPFHLWSLLRMFQALRSIYVDDMIAYLHFPVIRLYNFVCCLIISVHLTWKETCEKYAHTIHTIWKIWQKISFLSKWLNMNSNEFLQLCCVNQLFSS